MPYATVSQERQAELVLRALRRGSARYSGSDASVAFTGTLETVRTFDDERYFASGLLVFWHCGVRVLSVDFDRDMVTDFGYVGFSRLTNLYIAAWISALRDMRFIATESLAPGAWALDWTLSAKNNPKSPAAPANQKTHEDRVRARFRAGAPWVTYRDGFPWFHGPSYDETAVRNGERIMREIFGDGVSWRWFTADWVNGLWTKRFVSPEAEERWRARQERAA